MVSHKVAAAVSGTESSFERAARDCLCSDSIGGHYFRDISFEFTDGVLTVHGCVPTFYLKQIIQTRLKELPGVDQIDNQIAVISSTGLSSVRPR